ncbi:MAG: methylmalonyl Co-A mutase-associated GTPase MeaB [Acidobacteria bacterium]|nr:methylmalonyl Co-A mutase-associated GTPase MeaB [Acidobacteriota bacterium]
MDEPVSSHPDKSIRNIEEWIDRIRQCDVRAVARAISAIENRSADSAALLSGLRAQSVQTLRHSAVVGITGAAGTGKSTLTDALITELRRQSKTVGVLAIDPSSSVSGGALLGDRIRMQAHGLDPGVLIRSMATRGAVGGLAAATRNAVAVLDAAGKDFILIETVGVGQDEIAVAQLADVTVLLLAPGTGDGVQAMKAGLMEVADIYVLNKADDAGVAQLEADVVESLQLREPDESNQSARLAPIVRTVATEGTGVPQLILAIADLLAPGRPSKQRPEVPIKAALDDSAVLDHMGIAVASIAESLKFYEDAMGLRVSGYYDIPQELTRVAMLPAGEARIELLEATQPDSPIGRFLARRGPGLHHICIRVPDLGAALDKLKQSGAQLLQAEPQEGAGGHRYVFVHPASAGGVLLELVQAQ